MTSIDVTRRFLAQIRAQALAIRARPAGPAEPPPSTRGEAAPVAREAGLAAQLALRLEAIRRDDPQRRRRAFRIFLQAVLARECGVRSLDDGGIQSLADRVQETMEADPRLRAAIDSAGEALLQRTSVDL